MISSATHSVQLPPVAAEGPSAAQDHRAGQTPSPAKGAPAAGAAESKQLSSEEQAEVQKLRLRDREVRSHEQAHQAAGGQYVTSGPTYSYQQGPDGKRYAVGGEVGIDSSPEADPEATIRKMQVVRAAALAPANPSGQDRRVAAQAARQAAEARAELRAEQTSTSPSAADSSPAPGEILDVHA